MDNSKNESSEQNNSSIKLLEKQEEKVEKDDNKEQKEENIKPEKQDEKDTSNLKEEKNEETKEGNEEEQSRDIIENGQKQKKNKKVWIIALVILTIVIIIAILSTIFALVNIGNTKIMKNISIGEMDVSNLTKEEAQNVLTEMFTQKAEEEIDLKYDNLEAVVTYKALEVQFKIEDAVNKAYEIGRRGNVFKDNFEIIKTLKNGVEIEVEPLIDADMISQMSQNINNNLKDGVVQPSYYEENDNLIITAGKKGIKVDEPKLLEEIYKVINSDNESTRTITIPMIMVEPDAIDIDQIHNEVYKEVQNAYYTQNPFTIYPESDGKDFDVENAKNIIQETKEEYVIPLIITKPEKTINDIGTEAFPDKLGTCSTKYVAGNVNRTTNLKLAVQKINGTVLLPGQEFSYNKVVGERTIQAGYKEAATYSNGKVVDGLGGGICQISSTLYDAVVFADLEVTTRRNHQFVTSYLPAGKDATVVWGAQDFKFVNTRDKPIKIQATVSGGVATVSIWGIKEDVEYDISIETRKTATIAYTTQYIQDPSLPVGKEVVEQAGSNGRKVEAYKVKKLNGQVVSTTLLSKDTYNAMKRIIRVGTAGQ